jgi:hypothetical protein
MSSNYQLRTWSIARKEEVAWTSVNDTPHCGAVILHLDGRDAFRQNVEDSECKRARGKSLCTGGRFREVRSKKNVDSCIERSTEHIYAEHVQVLYETVNDSE